MKKNAKKAGPASPAQLLFPLSGASRGPLMGGPGSPAGFANVSASQGLARAVQLHQGGQLQAAETEYRKVLQAEPRQPTALTNLGALLCQQGRLEEGATLLRRAVELQPRQPDLLNNLGNALKAQGHWQEALQRYGEAIALQPSHVAALSNRASVLLELGNAQVALADTERALALSADYADAHNMRGSVLLALGRHAEALAALDRALALNPRLAAAYNNRGNVLARLRRHDEAVRNYAQALQANPNHASALSNWGNVLKEQGRHEEALTRYDQALKINPLHAETYYNRGSTWKAMKQYEAALADFDEAIRLRPDYASAFNNRGDVLAAMRRYDQALDSFAQALRLQPDMAAAFNNQGAALRVLRRYDEALQSFDDAMRLAPEDADARWNKALLALALGRYEEGWSLYEWRWRLAEFEPGRRLYPQPLWTGEADLAGKSIVLWAEQGLGDAVQFCRYAPLVRALGAEVTVEVAPPLVDLVASVDPKVRVVARGPELPVADFQCPLMSLPHAFKTTLSTIPAASSYLHADAARQARWRDILGPATQPRVGVVWSGSVHHKNDRSRSIALREFTTLLSDDYEFHSLHKEYRNDDLSLLDGMVRPSGAPVIVRHDEQLADFSDTAALISLLDLVVCVDTSVAHVAAALGKPTLILVAFESDYRWLLEREDSPWYDSVRLVRQTDPSSWSPVLDRAREVMRIMTPVSPNQGTST